MKKIVIYPNEILRIKTEEIKEVDSKLETDIKSLIEVLESTEIGVGLAAPQIGLKRRFFGIKDSKKKIVNVYVNPEIKKIFGRKEFLKIVNDKGKEEDFLEGCLSFPDYYGTLQRYFKIAVKWQEMENGKFVNKKGILTGLNAVVYQHELDHLNGVLFIDRVKEDGGKFFKAMGEKMAKWNVDKIKFT
ncbi:MAG: peptide deformylase [Candidatus Shapirobacteria bacterium]|nr:peptide deformylase [Candidatus Shapirobacteria bacterium]